MVTLSFLMFIMYIIKAVDRFVTTLFFLCNGSWSWFVNKIIPRLQYSSIFFFYLSDSSVHFTDMISIRLVE